MVATLTPSTSIAKPRSLRAERQLDDSQSITECAAGGNSPSVFDAAALLLVEANSLLLSLAERLGDAGVVRLSDLTEAQKTALCFAYPEAFANELTLRRLIDAIRRASGFRKRGVNRQAISAAKVEVQTALQAERELSASVDAFRATDDGTKEFKKLLKVKVAGLHAARKTRHEAGSRLGAIECHYQGMLRTVPTQVRERVSRSIRRIKATQLGLDVRRTEGQLRLAEQTIANYDRRRPWWSEAIVGAWWPYLEAHLPKAIVKGQEGESDTINGDLVDVHVAELRTAVVPHLTSELAAHQEAYATAVDRCEAVLHQWAEAGSVDAEIVSQLFASCN